MSEALPPCVVLGYSNLALLKSYKRPRIAQDDSPKVLIVVGLEDNGVPPTQRSIHLNPLF
jgi:hypothetical protein